MSSKLFELIFDRFEGIGARTQVDFEFVELMVRALAPQQLNNTSTQVSRWARLPGLCCRAAGGSETWADCLSAAWILYYKAADIMDSVEDQDQPELWWRDLGPATAINVSSGLFFIAAQILNELYHSEDTRQRANYVVDSFYRGFISMCAGQQLDLGTSSPNLEQAWEISKYKSGMFFGTATRSGAQLAVNDLEILSAYESYGTNIGMLVQIKDDLEEIKYIGTKGGPSYKHKVRNSLPFIYTNEVLSEKEREKLNDLLDSAGDSLKNAKAFLQFIDGSGAVLYLAAEVERLQSYAYSALKQSKSLEPAKTELEKIVAEFNLDI